MKTIIQNIFFTLCGLVLLWIAVSFYEVIANNMTPDYVYNEYNFFGLFFKNY